LTKGASITISAGAYLADGTKAAAKPAWSSSKTKVVRVSASGKITARALGRATVTLKAGAKATKIAVKVVAKRQPKVSAVKATGIPKTLAVGKTAWATGLYSPANATGVKIRYTSSNPKVASVDKNGAIKAVTKGTARIAVKAGAKARTYTVTVN
jgi:uncharacterized protein YjdB